jgi:dGTPase
MNDEESRPFKLARHAHHRTKIVRTHKSLVDNEYIVSPNDDNSLAVDQDVDEIAAEFGNENPPISECGHESSVPLYKDEIDFGRFAHENIQPQYLRRDLYKDHARIVHSPFFRLLSGKTQLFPVAEHSLVRNRLTHSLEVADIAKRIAQRISEECNYFKNHQNFINLDIISCAGLAHDIGHPPFAHGGEECLASLMKDFGGFESNAQTLRILSQLEKRLTSQVKMNKHYTLGPGLNLTFRTLASVIKYDRVLFAESRSEIAPRNSGYYKEFNGKYVAKKGYYREEAEIVNAIREKMNISDDESLYTLECSIMDIADDIAYSTYDLEDAMVVGLLHPFDVASVGHTESCNVILERVNGKLSDAGFERKLSQTELNKFFYSIAAQNTTALEEEYDFQNPFERTDFALQSFLESKSIATDRAMRRRFAEDRIARAIDAITVNFNEEKPFLSTVSLNNKALIETLILKEHNFERVIQSPQLKVFEKKVKRILGDVFEAIVDGLLDNVLPSDVLDRNNERLYLAGDDYWKKRLACDVISSMSEADVLVAYEALTTGKDLRARDFHLIG